MYKNLAYCLLIMGFMHCSPSNKKHQLRSSPIEANELSPNTAGTDLAGNSAQAMADDRVDAVKPIQSPINDQTIDNELSELVKTLETTQQADQYQHLIATLKRLQNGESVDLSKKIDQEENTVLHQAVSLGNPRITQFLLERGANKKTRNMQGYSPLHMAILMGNSAMVISLLENHAQTDIAAYLDLRDLNRYTALHLAVIQGNIEVVKMLVERGGARLILEPVLALIDKRNAYSLAKQGLSQAPTPQIRGNYQAIIEYFDAQLPKSKSKKKKKKG